MKVELRGTTAKIEGYVNVCERDSRPIKSERGEFIERIASGAFTRALERNNNVGLMFNHVKKLGEQKDGVLELREDNIGLYAVATVNDPDIIEKARNKELRGWSFGFIKKADEWAKTSDTGVELRTVTDFDLLEVSILDITPAYVATSINTRNNTAELVEHRASGTIDDVTVTIIEDPKPETRADELNKEFKDIVNKLRGKA